MSKERIGVIGLGLLGRGIVTSFLAHGFEVVAVERLEEQRESGLAAIEGMIRELIEQGGYEASLADEWRARYQSAGEIEAIRGCLFVVESVTEDAGIKREVLSKVEQVVSATAVIVTNTSAIPISSLQEVLRHPGRCLGMHWAGPAHATRFMELTRGRQTSDEAMEATVKMARQLGKEPSICGKDIPGFIVNRLGYALYREALALLDEGVADAETIDCSMRNAMGLWATLCGPFRWIDISGGPKLYAEAMNGVLPTLSNATSVPPVMEKLGAEGAGGTSNGRGFFEYTPEEAQRWEELYRRHAWRVAALQDEYFPLTKP